MHAPPRNDAPSPFDALCRQLFERSVDPMMFSRPDGTILRANPAACRAFGLTEEEICRQGRAARCVDDDALRAFLAERERAGQATGELKIRRGDGSVFSADVSSSVIHSEGGDRITCIVFKDVTARRRAEEALRESEQKLALLAGAMAQIVCVLAPDGSPEYVNPSWIEFSGMDLAATTAAGWAGVLHPDDLPLAMECRIRALRLLTPQQVELRYRAADGSHRWFLSRLAPVVEGERVVRLVGAAMEIEDRKRAEEAVREANEKLREADRRKNEFLGMLSHELRNPLAPIRNSTYILRHAEPGSEAARRAREVIERQTVHITRLVDDLLDVTRIARGKIELRRSTVDLREVVLRAADDFRPVMEDRGTAFRTSLPEGRVAAEVDAVRVAQAIGNLLHNAAKFTRRGDAVALSLAVEGGDAVITVRDTGAGIEPELLPRVFDPFVQGERTLARTDGGLGLGLALVKGVAELHGGAVRAESAGSGRGSEFAVRLPRHAERVAALLS